MGTLSKHSMEGHTDARHRFRNIMEKRKEQSTTLVILLGTIIIIAFIAMFFLL